MASAESLYVEVAVTQVRYRWWGVRLGRLFVGIVFSAPLPAQMRDDSEPEGQ